MRTSIILIFVLGLISGCHEAADRLSKPNSISPEKRSAVGSVQVHPTPGFAVSSDAQIAGDSFLRHLQAGEFEKALSICTEAIIAEAAQYGSAKEFFQSFLPLESFDYTGFHPGSNGLDEKRQVRFGCAVYLAAAGTDQKIQWWWWVEPDANSKYRVGFLVLTLKQYIEEEVAHWNAMKVLNSKAMEQTLPDINAVTVELTTNKMRFESGEPVLVTLKLSNGGSRKLEYRDQQVDVNDPFIVRNSEGKRVPYRLGSVKTGGASKELLPEQSIHLIDSLDISTLYEMSLPGKYTIQHSGKGFGYRVDSDLHFPQATPRPSVRALNKFSPMSKIEPKRDPSQSRVSSGREEYHASNEISIEIE